MIFFFFEIMKSDYNIVFKLVGEIIIEQIMVQ